MIKQILQSDVDLARKLAQAGHSDEHMVDVLCLRGIPRVRAAQLTDDIRHGRHVEPDVSFLPELVFGEPDLPPVSRPAERPVRRRPRARARSSSIWRTLLILGILSAILAAAFAFYMQTHGTQPEPAPSPEPQNALSQR